MKELVGVRRAAGSSVFGGTANELEGQNWSASDSNLK